MKRPSIPDPIVYLDVETGGLDSNHSLLQIAMVYGDGPVFSSYIGSDTKQPLVVDPYALAFNQIDLRESVRWPCPNAVRFDIDHWLTSHDLFYRRPLRACGFNVRFDVEHANRLYPKLFSHRVLDLVSVAMFHGLPASSQELMDWAGVPVNGRHDDAIAARTVHRKMMAEFGGAG